MSLLHGVLAGWDLRTFVPHVSNGLASFTRMISVTTARVASAAGNGNYLKVSPGPRSIDAVAVVKQPALRSFTTRSSSYWWSTSARPLADGHLAVGHERPPTATTITTGHSTVLIVVAGMAATDDAFTVRRKQAAGVPHLIGHPVVATASAQRDNDRGF